MIKVFNPTTSAQVNHNVNGNMYKIDPGSFCEVKENDVPDLLQLLHFLIVLDESDERGKTIISDKKEGEKEVEVSVEDMKKKHSAVKQFKCDLTVQKRNGETGLMETIPCGFTAVKKGIIVAHQKSEHLKNAYKADADGVENLEESPKRRGRTKKTDDDLE